MMFRRPLRVLAVVASLLACSACGIKGPLYLPPKAAPDTPAAAPGTVPSAPAATPGVAPSSPPTATPPVERKP